MLSGGGTGGHVLPILAVVEELKKQRPEDLELLFVGSRGGIEERIMKGVGIPCEFIHAGKIRRQQKNKLLAVLDVQTNFKNLVDIGKTVAGYAGALRILRKFKPDVVFIKGGYVGVPVGLGARTLNIPFAVHESDSVAGLANRILAKWASSVFVSFSVVWGLPKEKIVYTGNPVRSDIGKHGRDEGLEFLGMKRSLPTVFILGGSQGAHRINLALFEILTELVDGAQIIHGTGERDLGLAKRHKNSLSDEQSERYLPYAFLGQELPYAYAAADLVIARAGANVLAELAASAKPSLLIPLSTSANDHQLKNAQLFSQEGASHVLLDEELTSKRLLGEIEILLNDGEKRKKMSQAARKLYDPKAAFRISVQLLNLARRGK